MVYELEKLLKSLQVRYELNKKEHVLTLLSNGSQMLFGSSENPLSLEGAHVDFVWIDEGGQMARVAWEVAQRRTGMCDGPILITTIPYYEGWLKTEVYDPWLAGDQDITWISCKTTDNVEYSRKEFDRAQRTWHPAKFATHYLGQWAKAFGLIFPDPDDKDIIVEPFDIPEDWPAFAGHDWGYNAPTTGVWARLSPDDVLYITHDYEVSELTIDEHLEGWDRLGLTFIDEAFGDPAAVDQWTRAQQLGYPVYGANNAVAAGIDLIAERLRTGRLKIFRGCKRWLDHRATYRWAKSPLDEEVLLDRPAKPQNAEHVMDATRYLVMGVAEMTGSTVKSEPLVIARRRNLVA
jgi:terminase large subunit-like protein